MDGSLHCSQCLLWRFAKKCSFRDALRRSLVGPPLSEIGNNVCVGGFICRADAFSGLPILIPTEVENLLLILIFDDFVKIWGTDESSIIGFVINNKLKKIFASSFSKIIDSFLTLWGVPSFSRIFFILIGYSMLFSLKLFGSKSWTNSSDEILSQK